MATYFRIQPSGLEISHYSEDSAGDSDNLHVFDSPIATINCSENPTVYGDEVVEIDAVKSWDNGDVEGVAINPKKATITRRWTLEDFAREFFPNFQVDEEATSYAYRDLPYWFAVRNTKG